jgi:Zn-dependent protease with chaperone function
MSERKLTFSGALFDGRSAARQDVVVRLFPGSLTLDRTGREKLTWAFADLRLQPLDSHGHPPVHLDHYPAGAKGSRLETLVVDDPVFLSSLHAFGPEAPGFDWRERRRNRRFALIAGLILVPLLVYGVWAIGIPKMVDRMAMKVPVAWEEELGNMVLRSLFVSPVDKMTPESREALDVIVERLLSGIPDQPYQIQIYIHPSRMINALALPGGNIVVFQGLLNASDSAEELAGVLAHELQHILRRHSTRGILRSLASGFLFSLMLGDVNGTMQAVLSLADNLEGLKFSRAMESEADAEGMKMVLAAGIDPAAIVAMFQKFEKEEKKRSQDAGQEEASRWLDYLSTHPASGKRVARLRTLIEETPSGEPRPLLPGKDWATIMHKDNED